jgi:transcriptional regulator with XRE-family HTH domain
MTLVAYIGPRLKELRTERLMSQRDLAAKAGLSPTTIAKIETNKVEPNFGSLRKLCRALEVEPAELLTQ